MSSLHVFDIASLVPDHPCIAVFGNVPLLRGMAREHLMQSWGDAVDVTQWDVDKKSSIEWRDVRDEVATRSLFGGGKRCVWLRDADDFVSAYRSELEKYVASPVNSGILVLELNAFAANTKLYKAVAAEGVTIDCRVPQVQSGRGKPKPDAKRVAQWLIERAKSHYQCELEPTAAQALWELIGEQFGILDQELARMSLFVEPGEAIKAKQIRQYCGGWQSQTIWSLIDAMLDGEAAAAMTLLDQLLRNGDVPVALIAQIASTLRRFANAALILTLAQKRRRRVAIKSALTEAGFPAFRAGDGERQLKRLGPERAARLMDLIVEADLAIKGSHSSPHRARHALEKLILYLAQPREAIEGPIQRRTAR